MRQSFLTLAAVAAVVGTTALAGVATGATGAGSTTKDAASRAAAADSKVREVRLSPGTLAVRGLATLPLTVRVHLADPQGIAIEAVGEDLNQASPIAVLRRSGGLGPINEISIQLDLKSGSSLDGWWEGTVRMPSTADGTWSVAQLVLGGHGPQVCGTSPCEVVDVPAGVPSRKIKVIGTHRPKVTVGFEPAVVRSDSTAPLVVKGRVTDLDTGAGYAGAKLGLCGDTGCNSRPWGRGIYVEPSASTPTAVTGATGGYSFKLTGYLTDPLISPRLLALWGPKNSDGTITTIAGREHLPPWSPAVTISLARSSAPLGTPVAVTGEAPWALGCEALLQRRVNGAWTTVNRARIEGETYQYSLTAQPTTRGTFTYRVSVPACTPLKPQMRDGVSGTRRLTVT